MNETIKCTGGVRTEEEEAAGRLFQDLADGPRHSWWPKPGDSAKWKQPPTRGASTHDKDSQLLSVEEMSTAAAKTEKEVERRFQRLADVDRRALAMHRGGQAGDASLAAAYIDFSAKDPWEWWKSSSKLEGEEEVFALPLTGCIGMPSTPRFKEIYGRGCMMLTATPMPPPMEGKKLVVVKNAGDAEGKGALMEVREVDRATDLLVFGADGKLQTREGQFFGADKSGRNGLTYRLHFVMQRDQASLDASEAYDYSEYLVRKSLDGVAFNSECNCASFGMGMREEKTQTERLASAYAAKHRSSIVGSVIESVEDNLLHAFLDAEDASELQVKTEAQDSTELPPNCIPWCLLMFLKYFAALLVGITLFIVGGQLNKSDDDDDDNDGDNGDSTDGGSDDDGDDDGSGTNPVSTSLFVVGAVVIATWFVWLLRHMCCTSGTRLIRRNVTWAASTEITGTDEEALSSVEERERLNVKVEMHPLRDEDDEESATNKEPLCGKEATASTTRSAHSLHLTYREKRTGAVIDCRAVAAPDVALEKLTRALSLMSDLAEHADQTRGLGATLNEPSAHWLATRGDNAAAAYASAASGRVGSDLTNLEGTLGHVAGRSNGGLMGGLAKGTRGWFGRSR